LDNKIVAMKVTLKVGLAVRDRAAGSRSAALHEAVNLLRAAQLAGAYEDAWASWDSSNDAEIWDTAVADGLSS
jgi:hypothetical protein